MQQLQQLHFSYCPSLPALLPLHEWPQNVHRAEVLQVLQVLQVQRLRVLLEAWVAACARAMLRERAPAQLVLDTDIVV